MPPPQFANASERYRRARRAPEKISSSGGARIGSFKIRENERKRMYHSWRDSP